MVGLWVPTCCDGMMHTSHVRDLLAKDAHMSGDNSFLIKYFINIHLKLLGEYIVQVGIVLANELSYL